MEKVEVSFLEPSRDHDQFVESLPKDRFGYGDLYLYQGFWCRPRFIKPLISFQKHFQALDSDVLVASLPKSGTTWLKALTFSILNRSCSTLKDSPLLTVTPHQLVPFLELDLYMKSESPDLSSLPNPRIFATHTPYQSLPHSIKDSNCRIVYVCRNPVDQLISFWHFTQKRPRPSGSKKRISLDEFFEKYCCGAYSFGPVGDHVLSYWKAHLNRPEKVLFLKYEDMKQDIHSQAKMLADFLGCPFSGEEENQGVVQDVCGLCSLESLKNMEPNKTGTHATGMPNASFYRKGEVGDWQDLLSASKAEYLENLIEEKLRGSGLTLKISTGFPKEKLRG